MKISYVLPVFNDQNTVALTLKSLLRQEIKGEIIVIDDGSTDESRRIIKHYENKIDKVIYLDENKGAAHCRNLGNQLATSDIIAVCDCDIYYLDRCHAIKEAFEKDPDLGIFCSAVDCRDAHNKYIQWTQSAYDWDFKSKCTLSHPTIAYKRELALKHPYYEESKETDLFEFMLIDMHLSGAKLGGCQESTMLKIEGNRSRDITASSELKEKKYREYGISL